MSAVFNKFLERDFKVQIRKYLFSLNFVVVCFGPDCWHCSPPPSDWKSNEGKKNKFRLFLPIFLRRAGVLSWLQFKCMKDIDHRIWVFLNSACCKFWHFISKSVIFISCCPKQSDSRQFGRPSHWKGLSHSLRGGSVYIGRRWRSYAGWTQRGTKDVGIIFFPHNYCFLELKCCQD